jgi:DNA-binding response OmpR family regulator
MNILLVEDEPALRTTAAAALKLADYRVACAADGIAALARVHESRPDLVVLDLHMPDMDGWEFLRVFRSLPGCATTPVVVMSAAHQVKLEELDIQAFFEKPFDLDRFLDVIDALLAAPPNPTPTLSVREGRP